MLFLCRCVWQGEGTLDSSGMPVLLPVDTPIEEDAELRIPPSPSKKHLPRIRLPAEIIHKLRAMSERQSPQVRPSIK